MTRTAATIRPIDRLWGAVKVWTVLYFAVTVSFMAGLGYRVWLVGQLPGDTYLTETSYLVGGELEIWTTAATGLAYFVTYVVSAILVLMWYLRAVRNARGLSHGIETSPKWVVWWFIIPLVSLWMPYRITSELWRSSQAPEKWKRLSDPVTLRIWWALVLLFSFASVASGIMGRTAQSAREVQISDIVYMGLHILPLLAGVLFLKIGGEISARQTALIQSGYSRPDRQGPAWSS